MTNNYKTSVTTRLSNLACMAACSRSGCGRPAGKSMRVGGRHVAAVCSKRCGLELIGPDAGADDAEARRFADMAKMADILRALAKLRANVFEMTPIAISTATMPIGRRLEQDGVGVAKRLDEAIADARNTLQQIVGKRPYDMGRIDALMTRLREDITLDDLLDWYITTPQGQTRKQNGDSDKELLTWAHRNSPIADIANFRVPGGTANSIIESGDGRYLQIHGDIYQTNGKYLEDFDTVYDEFGTVFGQKSVGVHLDLVQGDWRLVIPLHNAPVELVDSADHSYTMPRKFCFVSQGVHAAIFYRERQLSGEKHIRYARMESGVPVLKATIPVKATSPLIDKITIDVNGNVWVIDNGRLLVCDANGVEVGKTLDYGAYRLTPHRWGGVWTMSVDSSGGNWCKCSYLIKQGDLGHPMDIGSGRQYELIGPKRGADDDAAAERDAAHQRLLNQRQEDKKRFTDMANLAEALEQLIKLRARPRGMSNAYVATATLKIGRRLASGDAGVDDGIDTIIARALTVIDDMLNRKPYNVSFVHDAMAKFRDALAADAALDAFDATPVGQSDRVRRMNDDERQLVAYRVNPLEKYFQFDVKPFEFVIDLGAGRIVTIGVNLINKQIYQNGKPIHDYFDGNPYTELYTKNITSQPSSIFLMNASNSYSLLYNIGGDSRRRIISTIGQYLLCAYLPFTEPAWDNKSEMARSVSGIECRIHFVAIPGAFSATLLATFSATGHTFVYNYASFAIDERGFVYALCASPDGSRYIVVYDKTDGKQIATITEPTGTIFSISPSIGGILVGILSSGSKYSIAKYRFAPDSAYYAGMKELLLPTPTAPSAAATAAV